MEITYQTDYNILQVKPTDSLEEKDFSDLATELENLEKDQRNLNGMLVISKEFPGYEKFSDMLAHAQFIREHGEQIPRVALCTDSTVGNLMKVLGESFTAADVRKFDYSDRDKAEKWLLS